MNAKVLQFSGIQTLSEKTDLPESLKFFTFFNARSKSIK